MKPKVEFKEDSYSTLARKEILLNTTLYPIIEKALLDPRQDAWKKISKGILKYRDRNISVLSSPYITKNMFFHQEDYDLIFFNLGIDEVMVTELIKMIKLPPGVEAKKNTTAFRVVMFLMIKFFLIHKKKKEVEMCLHYLAYSIYFSLYEKYYPYGVRDDVMRAAVNSMSMKFYLRYYGSLDLMLCKTAEGMIETYEARLKRCEDTDLYKLCADIKTRLNNQMHKIKLKYIETNEKNEAIGESIEEDEEKNMIETRGISNDVEVLSSQAQRLFFRGVNHTALNMSADMCQIPRTELRGAIEYILMERQIKKVTQFYAALISLYLTNTNTSASSIEELRSLAFTAYMLEIYKKGNSKDINIINVKKQMDEWLEVGCSKYKGLNSNSTKNNYRRAIFLYFVQVISMG